MPYANNKGADQPAYPRNLISTFVVRCLDSIIHLVSISEISRLYLASVAEQAGLSLPWSQTSKTAFLVTRLNFKTNHAFCLSYIVLFGQMFHYLFMLLVDPCVTILIHLEQRKSLCIGFSVKTDSITEMLK